MWEAVTPKISRSVFLNLWAIAQFSNVPRSQNKNMLEYSYVDT